jgi:hypothetical protein
VASESPSKPYFSELAEPAKQPGTCPKKDRPKIADVGWEQTVAQYRDSQQLSFYCKITALRAFFPRDSTFK